MTQPAPTPEPGVQPAPPAAPAPVDPNAAPAEAEATPEQEMLARQMNARFSVVRQADDTAPGAAPQDPAVAAPQPTPEVSPAATKTPPPK